MSGPGTRWWSPAFSGSGGQGLPGDFSSPSRFVRLAFLRQHTLPARTEAGDVAAGFHLLQNVAFPLGAVQPAGTPAATRLDSAVAPYDYTVYSTVLCAESRRLYWTTWRTLAPPVCRDGPAAGPADPLPDAAGTGMESFSATTGCRMCGPNENRPRKGYPSGGGCGYGSVCSSTQTSSVRPSVRRR